MEEIARKERIDELEFYACIWKDIQAKHVDDEAFFHYTQNIIVALESELDILTRMEN